MISTRHCLLSFVLVLGAMAAPCLADVIVVDANGGGDYVDLQDAIDAAVDGDTLLVRPGTYVTSNLWGNPFGINKALTIIGDGSGTVEMSQIEVDSLAAGKTCVLRGVSVRTTLQFGYDFPWALSLSDNQGHVWIEDCVLEPGLGSHCCVLFCSDDPAHAAEVRHCASVSFVRCQMIGGDGEQGSDGFGSAFCFAGNGGGGAWILDSNVSLYDCTLMGGEGGLPMDGAQGGGDGGAGILVDQYVGSGSALFLSGCVVMGGPGGDPGSAFPGPPGDGLHVFSDSSSVEYIECTFTASPGGIDLNAPAGTLHPYAGTARHFAITSPVREQKPGMLSIAGVRGDLVSFFYSWNGASVSMPVGHGWFLPDLGALLGPFNLGAITNADGTLDIPFIAPGLTPITLEEFTFLMQPLFQGAGGFYLGPGTAFTLVDSSF